MKNAIYAIVLLTLGVIVFGFAPNAKKNDGVCEIIALNDVTPELMDCFRNGELNDTAIECPKGSRIPLEIFLKGDFFQTGREDAGQLYLTILQTIYIRLDGNDLYFSLDSMNWKEFADFYTGQAIFELGVENAQPILHLGAELNHRD